MFVQAPQHVRPSQGGTGLGLWICKQLCQKMGGDITLYSKVDHGTTFVFYIRVDNDQVMENTLPRGTASNGRVNVLVVDDYAHNRDLHKVLLEREGVDVILACDGKEAVEKFKVREAGFFSFIMMDVQMPELNGFLATKMIRDFESEQNREKVDVYFVSGEYYNEEEVMSDYKLVEKNKETSGIRCLKKPIDIEIIRSIIEKYTVIPSNSLQNASGNV